MIAVMEMVVLLVDVVVLVVVIVTLVDFLSFITPTFRLTIEGHQGEFYG